MQKMTLSHFPLQKLPIGFEKNDKIKRLILECVYYVYDLSIKRVFSMYRVHMEKVDFKKSLKVKTNFCNLIGE